MLSAGAPGEIRTPDPQIRSLLLDQQPEAGSVRATLQITGFCFPSRRCSVSARRNVTPQITPGASAGRLQFYFADKSLILLVGAPGLEPGTR